MFGLRASRRAVIVTAIVATFVLTLVLARHAIVRTVLEAALSGATGYDVRFDDQRLGWSHVAFLGVHVVKNGDPILDAERVDVEYALRDIFPGGAHRYGFAAIAIQKPVLTITRHADGSITFTRPGGTSAAPPAATKQAATPLFFTLRIRDGVLRLIDTAPLQPDLANQTVDNVAVDASVKSDARTTARLDGVLLGRRTQGGAVARYPLGVRTVIDVQRGIALTRLQARRLPLRGALGFFIHSKAVRFDDGVLDNIAATYYGLVSKAGGDFDYRAGGGFQLLGGRIAVGALAKPIRDLDGTFVLADTTLATAALNGTAAGVPLHGRGALYDLFGVPRFRIALAADADARALKTLFAFSANRPVTGTAHLETLLAAQLADPLIRTWIRGSRVAYDRYPVDALDGLVDYYHGAVTIAGVHARYGRALVDVGGHIDFTDRGNDFGFVLSAHGAGADLPYADAFAPDATIDATALIEEPPKAGFDARGTILASGATSGTGTFAVDQYGVGEFGPFSFSRADGTSLAGAFELQRPISASAGWLHLRDFRIAEVRRAAALPGVRVPQLPPLAGIVDGDLAVGGTPSTFGLAGTVRGRGLRVAGYPIGAGSVSVGGTFDDVRLTSVAVDGPLGRFRGRGAYGTNLLALDGDYDGSLAQLRTFVDDPTAVGGVHGPVRATIGPKRVVIQTTGAQLAGARVRGVAVERVSGTIALDGKQLRVVAADGALGGGHAVAADLGGPFLVSAPDVPVGALRGAGIPLESGTLGMLGVADLRGTSPRFDGVVTVSDGSAAGYPVSGGADLSLAGSTVTLRDGVAGLGTTFGSFAGTVAEIGRANRYDLNASIPIGDVEQVRTALHLPLRTLYGSFAADLRVRGAGAAPALSGNVAVPEGSYNGLDFRDARAGVALDRSSVAAHDGVVTVGSTRANVDASAAIAQRAFAVNVHSADANLADFDDYFDEAETLAGRGPVAFAFANDGLTTRTSGRFDVRDFRYRRFAFGTTDATWSQPHGAPIAGAVNVQGEHGTLHANGTIAPAPGDPIAAFAHARYGARVQTTRVDLATWLPPFGITAPLLGQVDARGTVAGRWPRLTIAGDATLQHGSVYGYAVRSGTLHARSDGGRLAFTNSVLDLGFARFDVNGSLGYDARAPLALSVHAQTPDLARTLVTMLPKGPRYDIAGAVQSDARITGTFAHPRATVGFDVTQGRYGSLAIARILGSAAYDGTTLTVNDAEATFAKGSVLVAGALPLRLEPLGLRPGAPLSFQLAANGLDLAPFAPFVPGPHTKLGGTLDGRVAIEGTPRAPRIAGNAALTNGSYVSDFDRAGIAAANARFTFNGNSVALDALHAKLGAGTLDGSGSLDLPFPGAHTSGYSIALVAHGARVDSPEFGRGTIDGTMTLARGPTIAILSGDLTLSNASIPFATIFRTAAGGNGNGAANGPVPFDLGFNLRANAGRNVRVQSSIVDVGAKGTLDLTGTLRTPRLAGVLTATPGGVFSTYNRAFRVQQAVVRFDPAQGVVPYLDLRAYAHVTNPDPDPTRNAVGSADITVTVQGPADELAQGGAISFSSNPPYSQEQIVGLLLDASLFGAVNFGQQSNGTTLRGAPGESNVLLPPGVTPYQSGTINFNQEAFSILNGQFTQRFLAPIERVFIGALNLSDLEVTVDYGGGVGYNALKQIGHRDVYASFGQTLSNPLRTTLGFTARPDAATSASFSYFTENGNPAIATSANGNTSFNNVRRLNGLQPLNGRQGFTFLVVRKFR